VGGAHPLRAIELPVVDVDRDDRVRAGQRRPRDRGRADATAADHGDALAARDVAGVDRGTQPGHDSAAEQTDGSGPRGRVDLRALTGGHQGLLRERADAERRRQLGAVGERHLLGRVVGGEAVPRLAPVAGAAVAAHRPPVQDHEVARRHRRDVVADRLDDTGRLVPEQEREVVVDAALPVVQVGVADPACLHVHQRLARSGVGDVDRLDADRLALRAGDDCLDLVHAGSSP
jgi:hypothetical protein